MTTKPTKAKGPEQSGLKFLAAVPDNVRSMYASDWFLEEREPRVVEAAQRLVCDERMRVPWEKLARNFNTTGGFVNDPEKWGEFFAGAAVNEFDQALRSDHWDSLTQREMDAWKVRLSKAVAELISLAETGPLTPKSLGLSVIPIEAQQEYLAALGIPLGTEPYTLSTIGSADSALRRKLGEPLRIWELDGAARTSRWSIGEVLRMYEKQMFRAGSSQQALSKPGDAKADRARFIVKLTEICHRYYDQPMQELVATTAAVMFEDEAINVRLVRRLTVGK